MDTNTTAVPVPSLSTETGNAILSAFLDASTPIEHIAQEFSLTVGTLFTWLRQHQQLITELTSTLEQRAKLLALRAEVIAMDVLRQIAELSRDPEARRKAASKLLSHIKRTPGASPGPHAPTHTHAAAEVEGDIAPSPRRAGRSVTRAACDDEGLQVPTSPHPSEPPSSLGGANSSHAQRTPGASPGPHAPSPCSTTAKECSPRATNVAGSVASLVRHSACDTDATNTASSPLHAEGVAVCSGGLAERSDATPR